MTLLLKTIGWLSYPVIEISSWYIKATKTNTQASHFTNLLILIVIILQCLVIL